MVSRSRSRGKSRYRTPRNTPVKRGRSMTRSASSKRSGKKRRVGGYSPSRARTVSEAVMEVATNPTLSGAQRALSNVSRDINMRAAANKYRSSSYLNGYYGGKATFGPKRKSSFKSIAKKGITLQYEKRKTITGEEAIAVGHTSMPPKVCAINLWRALIKYLMINLKVQIKDYGNALVPDGFVSGDIIRLNTYVSDNASSVTATDTTINANSTYDGLAATLAAAFGGGTGYEAIRFDSIELLPLSTSRFTGINLNLVNSKIIVETKSTLKIQNVTTEVSTDNEADDVNAVPLDGKIFHCKGNNFVKKANNAMLPGLFSTDNEEAIYAGYTKQQSQIIGGQSVGFYGPVSANNNDQTTFFKPSEPPKHWEIQNCLGEGKLLVEPGSIKTSVLTQQYTMSLTYYFQLLYGFLASKNGQTVFNEKLGKTNVMYLEKTVGKAATESNMIKLWVELDFKQTCLITNKMDTYTLPIQYQADY